MAFRATSISFSEFNWPDFAALATLSRVFGTHPKKRFLSAFATELVALAITSSIFCAFSESLLFRSIFLIYRPSALLLRSILVSSASS